MLVVSLLNDYSVLVDRCSLFAVVLLSFIATSISYRGNILLLYGMKNCVIRRRTDIVRLGGWLALLQKQGMRTRMVANLVIAHKIPFFGITTYNGEL